MSARRWINTSLAVSVSRGYSVDRGMYVSAPSFYTRALFPWETASACARPQPSRTSRGESEALWALDGWGGVGWGWVGLGWVGIDAAMPALQLYHVG